MNHRREKRAAKRRRRARTSRRCRRVATRMVRFLLRERVKQVLLYGGSPLGPIEEESLWPPPDVASDDYIYLGRPAIDSQANLCDDGDGGGHGGASQPAHFPGSYSADIAAAWEVVASLAEQPYVKVRCETSFYHGDYCSITAPHDSQISGAVRHDALAVHAESMPLAICLAALKAVGVEVVLELKGDAA
jgi:hypothetical protein